MKLSRQIILLIITIVSGAALVSALVRPVIFPDEKVGAHAKTNSNSSGGITNRARAIKERDDRQPGIDIEEPEIYDDAALREMLLDAEAKLAALQVFDQNSIVSKLGTVSGVTQDFSSFALSVQGPSLPGVQTTQKSGTSSVLLNDKLNTNTGGQTTSETSSTTNSTAPTTDIVTNRAPFSPPTAAASQPSVSLPTSAGVASSRILGEQVQLTAQIQSLRLLLRGSLTGHFVKKKDGIDQHPRLKTTLGFPVTISPYSKKYKNAVAVVEVEVENKNAEAEPPVITAVLPQEKTYNVAAITEKSMSVGGGVATQIVGVSGSFLSGRKTYFMNQDQDTVAITFRPSDKQRKGFGWQFRPVLGQRYVQTEKKTVFAQLGFDAFLDSCGGEIGKVYVRSYWRKYDSKRRAAGEMIEGSLNENDLVYDIPCYKLNSGPTKFDKNSIVDLGEGNVMVNIQGRFLPNTRIRIGNQIPPITREYKSLRFLASIDDLVSNDVKMIGPDGDELPLEIIPMKDANTRLDAPPVDTSTGKITVQTIDENMSKVTLRITDGSYLANDLPLIFVAGRNAFGTSFSKEKKTKYDEPFNICRKKPEADLEVCNKSVIAGIDSFSLSAEIPTALLIEDPTITVTSILAPKRFETKVDIPGFNSFSKTDSLSILEPILIGKEAYVKFLLVGNRLTGVNILNPKNRSYTDPKSGEEKQRRDIWIDTLVPSQADTIQVVTIHVDLLETNKFLVLQRKTDDRPFLIAIPSIEKEKIPEPKAQERVLVDADETVIEGVSSEDIEKITWKDKGKVKSIDFEGIPNTNAVKLKNLKDNGVTVKATPKTLTFVLKVGAKPTVKLEVISARVETVPK